MATAAQILDKTRTPYQILVTRLADQFEDGDLVRAKDLPVLTDDDLAIVLNHESGVGLDACRPGAYAEILNSSIYLSPESRIIALGAQLHSALTFEVRDFLAGSINDELSQRSEPVGDMERTERSMDEAGHRETDFV